MTQFVCNPITVDAFQIVSVGELKEDGSRDIALDNGENYTVEPGKMSRMTPAEGDYLVKTHQPDEYEYLNPKHVFEAKYTKLPATPDAPAHCMSNEELEKRLENCPAERVTKGGIEERISSTEFNRLGDTVTHCRIILDNGFSVSGESACVNPENYNEEIGQKIAYDNAFRHLWPLFGFLLAEKNKLRHQEAGSSQRAA